MKPAKTSGDERMFISYGKQRPVSMRFVKQFYRDGVAIKFVFVEGGQVEWRMRTEEEAVYLEDWLSANYVKSIELFVQARVANATKRLEVADDGTEQ